MQIYINMKTAGSRKPALVKTPYEIPDSVGSVKELLESLVKIEVERYNQKNEDATLIKYLTETQIEEQASTGKVSFGRVYSDKKADPGKAVENALQCYQDGLVRVFRNEQELEQLDEKVHFEAGDEITLIRLTFLAGRMW